VICKPYSYINPYGSPLCALKQSTILLYLRDFFHLNKQQYKKLFKQLDGSLDAKSPLGISPIKDRQISVLLFSSKVRIILPLIFHVDTYK